MTYRAPVPDIVFTMRHVAGLDRAAADGIYGDLSVDLAQTILEEAGRFANDVIAPLNAEGDRHGATLKDGAVTTAPGWKDAYRPGRKPDGTRSQVRSITAGRACRRCSTRPASRCGTPPPWPSASARC